MIRKKKKKAPHVLISPIRRSTGLGPLGRVTEPKMTNLNFTFGRPIENEPKKQTLQKKKAI